VVTVAWQAWLKEQAEAKGLDVVRTIWSELQLSRGLIGAVRGEGRRVA